MQKLRKQVATADLLVAIAHDHNDTKLFDQLYAQMSKLIFSHAFGILRNAQLAEDVLQETMILIWRKAATYKPERGSAQGWIMTIAHNKTIDLIRKQHHDADLENSKELSVQAQTKQVELSIDLKKALSCLSNEQRTLVDLAYFKGYTHQQIADILKIPIGTVKSQLYTALKGMRYEIEQS